MNVTLFLYIIIVLIDERNFDRGKSLFIDMKILQKIYN